MARPHQFTRLAPLNWLVMSGQQFDRNSLNKLDTLVVSPLSPLCEWVVGDGSMMLTTKTPMDEKWVRALVSELENVDSAADFTGLGRIHRIEVCFDGPDLAKTARHFGMTVQAYIEIFCSVDYNVAFMGFAPGFGYLTGGEVSEIPRLQSPRQAVAKGAVAVAAGYTSIYPAESPGGWNWIGQTSVDLFNPTMPGAEAFLLAPSDSVQFIAIA